MNKKLILTVVPWLISAGLIAVLAFGVKYHLDYQEKYAEVIKLENERPELVEAVIKVQAEEEKETQAAIKQVKENSVKKILSPLVVDVEVEE